MRKQEEEVFLKPSDEKESYNPIKIKKETKNGK